MPHRVHTSSLPRVACMASLALSLAALPPAPTLRALGDEMVYVFNAPESESDLRYVYQWQVLREALDATRAKWGPYRLVRSAPMSERRQAHELLHATGKLSVMYLDTRPEFERTLHAIHIPVDRNLVGYRVLLVHADRRDDFRHVQSIDQLKRFRFGLGLGWADVDVLRHSGLRVVTGSSYDGLFFMLVHRRFDAFLRGAVEVLEEQAQRARRLPQLWIEDSLLLYYPMPMYFWFARTAEGKRLAERAEQGMRAMLDDGRYDQIFERHQRPKIERLKLAQRHILRLPNPLLGPETPLGDERLWFDPHRDAN